MIQYQGQWIAAEHKDAFFQRLREGVAASGPGGVKRAYADSGSDSWPSSSTRSCSMP